MANWLRIGLLTAGVAATGVSIGLSMPAPGISLAECAAGYTGSPDNPQSCVPVPGESQGEVAVPRGITTGPCGAADNDGGGVPCTASPLTTPVVHP